VIPTVSRSDIGRLTPILECLDDYHLVIHPEHDNPDEAEIHPHEPQIVGDVCLILGDRYEMLSAAADAIGKGIPIAHIGGGYVTEGSFDNRTRNALTWVADAHYVANERCARNIAWAQGEILVTGAPDIDLVRLAPCTEREYDEKYILVCLHPEPTMNIKALVGALDQRTERIAVTAPCNDRGRDEIIGALSKYAYLGSVGALRYINLMRNAKCVIGNSSSGKIEGSYLGIPVVDIGPRQKGREADSNVVHCDWDELINVAIEQAIVSRDKKEQHLYGDGYAAQRIAKHLMENEWSRI